ncbi:MAG: aminoglycoside phosphotransferase family protein [Chloroflexi bacterium]|nr:MAG: aminoglycoside phosphotransferase family protein [Chloroflexota bacterium]
MAEELPLGGNLNDAVRVGDTVRRRAGPWTPAVHTLLRFLEAEGFPAPRARGMDEEGREVLDYIEGEAHAGNPIPLPDSVFDEGHMIEAARLLRRYHDIVARFRPSPELVWRLVSPGPHELILHNDWSPWNALFRDGRFALTLDWDLAGPGPRMWDVANAAYCWVPLIAGASAIPDSRERARRLGLFADAYGLEDRAALIPALRARLVHVGRFIDEQAKLGDPGMVRLVGWDTPRQMFVKDLGYIDENRGELERALA